MEPRKIGRLPLGRPLLAVLAAVLLASGTAQAFYWNNWPGARKTPPDTLVPDDGGEPPGPFDPPPGGGPEDPEEPNEPAAPEPSTIVGGLMGLAVIGVRRWRRKLNAK